MTITTKATAKVAAVAAGLAMATSMLSLAPLAHAQTPTTPSTCTITMSLTVGSTGAEVICLQAALVAKGYLVMPVGTQMGYFGALTKTAVAKWQAANNIAPAVGYFGPISRAAFTGVAGGTSMVPGCTSTTGYSTTTGQSCATTTTFPAGCTSAVGFSPTTGVSCSSGSTSVAGLTGAGVLANESTLGDVTTDLKEGDSVKNVVGDSFVAKGGDVAIQRVDAVFTIDAGSNSSNLNRYVSDVSVYLDGKKLGSIDPALGTKDGKVWTYRFTGLNGVIKSGMTGNIYVAVTPVSSIGSSEDGTGFTATIPQDGVRAVAADGISDTYVASNVNTTGIQVSSATSATLTASENSSNPKASQVAVSESDAAREDVTLLAFDLKAKNTDVTINDLPVQLGTSDALGDVISSVKLYRDSKLVTTKSVGTGSFGTTTFSNINQKIAKDETAHFTLKVNLKGEDSNSNYSDGTTVVASTTRYGWDVEDATGASVSPSAGVSGNSQTLTASGIAVTLGTPKATVATAGYSGGLDIATVEIPFTVKAGDNAVWIGGTATNIGTGNAVSGSNNGVAFATTTGLSSGKTSMPTGSVVGDPTYGDSSLDANSNFYVGPNTSRTFTLNMPVSAVSGATAGVGNAVQVAIKGINYSTTNTMSTTYYTSNLSSFQTPIFYVAKH